MSLASKIIKNFFKKISQEVNAIRTSGLFADRAIDFASDVKILPSLILH